MSDSAEFHAVPRLATWSARGVSVPVWGAYSAIDCLSATVGLRDRAHDADGNWH